MGCSPRGREESDTTERLHFHFSLSCIGERNGNPLQCSCLENPRDEAAWWAAVCGVAQSRTRLKRLSSSSKAIVSIKRVDTFSRIKCMWRRNEQAGTTLQVVQVQLEEKQGAFLPSCIVRLRKVISSRDSTSLF